MWVMTSPGEREYYHPSFENSNAHLNGVQVATIATKILELPVTHEHCSFSPGEKVRMRAGKKTLYAFA